MGRAMDPAFHMATEAMPLLRNVVRARWRPRAMAQRGWTTVRHGLQVLEQLPHDLSRLLRNVRRGRVHIHLDIANLRRVGDQLDRAASRLAMALLTAALIIGSSIVMTVGGGPTLLGLPAFGLIGFVGATIGGLWLVRSIRRSGRHDDDEPV
jgi:ubiquinone biosynthesis protein